jgi:uncharacterized protein (UPF0305 family)
MPTVTESDFKELKDLILDLKTDIQTIDKKLDIHIVRTNERLDALNQGLPDLKKQSEKQDNRLWVLISAMFVAPLVFVLKTSVHP